MDRPLGISISHLELHAFLKKLKLIFKKILSFPTSSMITFFNGIYLPTLSVMVTDSGP